MNATGERKIEIQYTGEKGVRLDKYLTETLPEFTRSRIQHLIEEGCILVNGKTAGKSGFPLEPNTLILMTIPEVRPVEITPSNTVLDVLFENDEILVINKPAGIVVHPSMGHDVNTIVNAVVAYAPDLPGISGEHRPGIVHRLDKDTSGVLVMAKTDSAMQQLQEQFKNRQITKMYIALVDGKPPTPTGRIEAPIGRDPAHRKRMAVVSEAKGRDSVTRYETTREYRKHTLLNVYPLTGRTHQIRVHLAMVGCPIAGDMLYGYRKSSVDLNRHFLHAFQISLIIPGEVQPRRFEAPLSSDLEKVLQSLD